MIISLFVGILSARYLGPSNYGLINYCWALIGFFAPLYSLGLYGIIVTDIVKKPEDAGRILGSAILMRLMSSILSIVGIAAIMAIARPNDPLAMTIVLLQSGVILFQAVEVINYWFQAKLNSKIAGIIQVAAYAVMAGYRIILLMLKADVRWFSVVVTLEALLVAVGMLAYYRKNSPYPIQFHWQTGVGLVKRSYHYILSALMTVAYVQTDKMMLGQLLGETTVGYYAVAGSICTMWTFALVALIDSVRPSIVVAHEHRPQVFRVRLIQLYGCIIWISFAAALVFTLFGRWIVLLLYKEPYLPAAEPLGILCWATAFSFLGVARSIWTVCEGQQRYEKWIALVGSVCNVSLNLWLIPLWGINGAATATLLSQIVANLVMPILLPNTRANGVLMLRGIVFFTTLRKREGG